MTKRFWIILAILTITGCIWGQQKPPQPPATPPTGPSLTVTEQIALTAISAQFQRIKGEQDEAQKALAGIQADIAKDHPGFHLDLTNGKLAKDEPKK